MLVEMKLKEEVTIVATISSWIEWVGLVGDRACL